MSIVSLIFEWTIIHTSTHFGLNIKKTKNYVILDTDHVFINHAYFTLDSSFQRCFDFLIAKRLQHPFKLYAHFDKKNIYILDRKLYGKRRCLVTIAL